MAAVLIVDDEKEVRGLLRQIVEREGHDVLEACDGFEALAVLDREDVGLAVVDLVMPHMNGVELMQRMQKKFPDTKIVTVSAYGPAVAASVSSAGPDDAPIGRRTTCRTRSPAGSATRAALSPVS